MVFIISAMVMCIVDSSKITIFMGKANTSLAMMTISKAYFRMDNLPTERIINSMGMSSLDNL